MKDLIKYEDYMGSVHFSCEDETFYGKIEGIDDLVTFEGKSVKELTQAFQEAVKDYLDTCKRYNKEAEKSYKGSFNVRINPELHKKVKRTAVKMGLSLNQFVQKAIEDELNQIELSLVSKT
ncbi:MAG: type II toxin-antitoxin system HicB family antitoxin [Spirochaetaceae bacterium]|nr:type II toxin-antitoxin system HicB family antitoxin [Spirochaetaceae bacterium]